MSDRIPCFACKGSGLYRGLRDRCPNCHGARTFYNTGKGPINGYKPIRLSVRVPCECDGVGCRRCRLRGYVEIYKRWTAHGSEACYEPGCDGFPEDCAHCNGRGSTIDQNTLEETWCAPCFGYARRCDICLAAWVHE